MSDDRYFTRVVVNSERVVRQLEDSPNKYVVLDRYGLEPVCITDRPDYARKIADALNSQHVSEVSTE